MRAGTAGPGKVVIDRAELERMRELGDQLEQRIESLEGRFSMTKHRSGENDEPPSLS